MSGGHFDYGCFRIAQFADELQMEINNNDSVDPDCLGEHYCSEMITELQRAQILISTAAKLAKEIEWLYSGDIGLDSCASSIRNTLEGLCNGNV